MRHLTFKQLTLVMLTLCLPLGIYAQRAPGEDPLRLTAPVQFQGMPAPAARSGDLDASEELSASLRAKILRFEAKAMAAEGLDSSIATDADVVASNSGNGLRRVCRQEVGSTTSGGIGRNPTTGNGGRPGSNQQIVVLRGDLVNICR